MSQATTENREATGEAVIREVDARRLKEWVEAGEAEIVDVREPDEHMREHIPGSTLVPLSSFDPTRVPTANGRKAVLHCRSGNRSRQAAEALLAFGHREAYHLEGGIQAWKSAGLPTERRRVPISIMRQVQLTVGTVVVVTALLGALHSAWWLVVTGFFGAGLLVAGATGTCGLATVLGYMPWNRAFRGARSCEVSSGCST